VNFEIAIDVKDYNTLRARSSTELVLTAEHEFQGEEMDPDPTAPTLHIPKPTHLHPLVPNPTTNPTHVHLLIPNPTPNPIHLHPLDLDPTLPPGSRVLQ